jgi:hypothetical protein
MTARFTTLLDPRLLARVDTSHRHRARRRWDERRALAGQVLELSAQVVKPTVDTVTHRGAVPALTRVVAAANTVSRAAGDAAASWHTTDGASGDPALASVPGGPDPDGLVPVTFVPASGRLMRVVALGRRLLPRSIESHRSLWSSHSMYSALSLHSFLSGGSVLSIGSAGSLFSAGSIGSILSIGSVGSVLSIGSAGSVLSIGSAGSVCRVGGIGQRTIGDGGSGPSGLTVAPTTRLVQHIAGAAALCAVVAAAGS